MLPHIEVHGDKLVHTAAEVFGADVLPPFIERILPHRKAVGSATAWGVPHQMVNPGNLRRDGTGRADWPELPN